jgi:acyl-CoA thioesterase-1
MKSRYFLLFFWFFCWAETAWSVSPRSTVLTVGDSLTFGLGVAPEKTWPALLEERLKKDGRTDVTIINAGSSGATTAFGVSSLKFHLKRTEANLVIYALGANDGLRGMSPEATYQNLKAAMELLKDKPTKVLLVGMKAPPNYGNRFPKEFEASFARIAREYKVEFVPFLLEGVAGVSRLNQADGIHPNEKGYEKIVELLYPKVKELL